MCGNVGGCCNGRTMCGHCQMTAATERTCIPHCAVHMFVILIVLGLTNSYHGLLSRAKFAHWFRHQASRLYVRAERQGGGGGCTRLINTAKYCKARLHRHKQLLRRTCTIGWRCALYNPHGPWAHFFLPVLLPAHGSRGKRPCVRRGRQAGCAAHHCAQRCGWRAICNQCSANTCVCVYVICLGSSDSRASACLAQSMSCSRRPSAGALNQGRRGITPGTSRFGSGSMPTLIF